MSPMNQLTVSPSGFFEMLCRTAAQRLRLRGQRDHPESRVGHRLSGRTVARVDAGDQIPPRRRYAGWLDGVQHLGRHISASPYPIEIARSAGPTYTPDSPGTAQISVKRRQAAAVSIIDVDAGAGFKSAVSQPRLARSGPKLRTPAGRVSGRGHRARRPVRLSRPSR